MKKKKSESPSKKNQGTEKENQRRKKAEMRVEEVNLMKDNFIRIVSHQLRTPLNAIRWNLELILKGEMGDLTDSQREFLQMTYEAELNVLSRLNDLLTVIDIEEGRIAISRETVSIESLLNSTVSSWQKKFKLKNIDFHPLLPAKPLPPLAIDAGKIRTVFDHLLNNAYDYTDGGGSVTAKLSGKNGIVRFEVSDTGIGIPKVEQRRIFRKFYRATNASSMSTDRSGVSLAACKYYIKQQGGKIGFRSIEGKGSTFWFELPLASR